jgi:hypothetical protein
MRHARKDKQITRQHTPFEKIGPMLKPGFRVVQASETELDHFSETLSQLSVNTTSMADKVRREKFAKMGIAESHSVHLFVLVHGFQATGADMRTIRNHLQTALPASMFLISHANEKDTDSPITLLGKNLATEVQEFINLYLCGARRQNTSKRTFLGKLSFIGHSLGGIIIREAIKHL